MSKESGTIVSVSLVTGGSELVGDHPLGSTVLIVDNAYDFDEDGGELQVGDEVYTYDPDYDDDAGTITLTTATTVDYLDTDEVIALPLATEKVAKVVLDGSGDGVEATVSDLAYPFVAEGIRESGEGEIVDLSFDGEDYVIESVLGFLDASEIDPLTTIPPSALSDGFTPASSPTVTTLGAVGLIFAKWPAISNPDAVTYDLHVSATDGFTPDTVTYTTRVSQTPATMVAVKQLPDGTPLAYGVNYYFVAVARDSDGQAAPGVQSAATQMNPANTADINVGAITAAQLLADAIDGMTITGSTFQTAATGQRLVWDSTGITAYGSDGAANVRVGTDGTAFFRGDIDAKSLHTQQASLGGVTTGEAAGTFVLSAGAVPNPTLAPDHASVPAAVVPLITTLHPKASNAIWDTTASRWFRASSAETGTPNRMKFYSWDATGATVLTQNVTSLTDLNDYATHHSLAMNATHAFVLQADKNGVYEVSRFPRPTSTTFSDADCRYVLPTVTGGYVNTPVVGLAGDGDLLVAYTVTGAQTIATLSFADKDVFVGKYSMVKTGAALVLTATKSIRLNQAATDLASVKMDATSVCFDLAVVAGNTGLVLSGKAAGLGAFGLDHIIFQIPNSGTAVTAVVAADAAKAWYTTGHSRGLAWNGTYFYALNAAGTSMLQYTNSGVGAPGLYHGYSFYNSATAKETLVSPLDSTDASIFPRHISRWTIPILPPGVTQVRIYVGNDPARLRLERQGGAAAYYTGVAGSALFVEAVPTALPVGTANATNPPSATNTFPTGTAYSVGSETGGFVVRGDGTMDAPLKMQCGTVTITPSAANTPTDYTLTFPVPFAAVPFVAASSASAVPGTVVTGVAAGDETATTCRITITRTNTSATTVRWIAMIP